MKDSIIKILKKFKIFKFVRNVYNIFFKKSYIYQKFQRLFTGIKLRFLLAKIEKKIFKLFYISSKTFFLNKINKNDELYIQLEKYGNTEPFQIRSLEENKEIIIKYFKNQKIFNDKNPNSKFLVDERDPNLEVGYFDYQITARCPHIFEIVNDERLITTLSTYFDGPYKLDYISTWWSFKNLAMNPKEKTQYFHRDLDNFNFVKLFIYLTDVDEENGAHEYIRFSHKNKIENEISTKAVSLDKLSSSIQKGNLYKFIGKSGSATLENTFGLHRGSTPKTKDRLMIAMAFSLVKTPYSPSKPFISSSSHKVPNIRLSNIINQNYFVNK